MTAKAFGINLVTRWRRSGRLKIIRSLCPNLCSEAPRYHYAGAKGGFPESEEPSRAQPCPRSETIAILLMPEGIDLPPSIR